MAASKQTSPTGTGAAPAAAGDTSTDTTTDSTTTTGTGTSTDTGSTSTSDAAAPAGTVGTPADISTAAVNDQIMGAVQATTEFSFGLTTQLNNSDGTTRLSAGVAIAYDKAAQAAALGVQDATDYERNVLSISSAAQGKALAMILAGDNVQDAAIAFVLALVASVVAPIVVAEVGIAQTHMLDNFPQA